MREILEPLLSIVDKLHERHERADRTTVYDFEPGEIEYLEQSDGIFVEEKGEFILHFEAKGTRYYGRTFVIERIEKDDPVSAHSRRSFSITSLAAVFFPRQEKAVSVPLFFACQGERMSALSCRSLQFITFF